MPRVDGKPKLGAFEWRCILTLRLATSAMLLAGLLDVWGSIAVAEPATDAPVQAPRAVAKHSGHKGTAAKRVPAAEAPAPWAAIDPGRATGATAGPPDPSAAAVPGIVRTVRPDEDRIGIGAKWSSSNTPNAGQYSIQGVTNEINHDLGAPNAVGTDAEVGLKMHF